ncbi:YcnI family copper-binding membrane protein [Myceligenerans salitolerans]|uniref:YcnI family protein n=1 Tax=Myceligenerans salitolerans TaxID=1230528 RepID=A0ABS3I8D5_9MICO|nr:YcnI family protein [Myceligenerans salitolerans]MBO0609280.1 YcnI family protein [Myceligenerans salitolerans]
MNRTTVVRRVILSGLAAVGLVALGTAPATAHVTITPSTTAAGATAVLRVEIPHGCEESATTAISLRTPEGVGEVSATDLGRWTVDRTADGLTWTTDEPLPDGEHDEVEFSLRLPEAAGATLVFPVVQRCEEGEVAWTEVAEHGEGHDDLERPAPVVVVAGDPEAAGASAGTEDAGAPAGTEAASAVSGTEGAGAASDGAGAGAASGGGSRALVALGAAGLLVVGFLAAGVGVLRHRRRA